MIELTVVNPYHPDGAQYQLTVDAIGTREELVALLMSMVCN